MRLFLSAMQCKPWSTFVGENAQSVKCDETGVTEEHIGLHAKVNVIHVLRAIASLETA